MMQEQEDVRKIAQKRSSAKEVFDHRDALIRDRLHRMKAAATDIMNLINLPQEYGMDCDGACSSCVLSKDGLVHCSVISEIEAMTIPEAD